MLEVRGTVALLKACIEERVEVREEDVGLERRREEGAAQHLSFPSGSGACSPSGLASAQGARGG